MFDPFYYNGAITIAQVAGIKDRETHEETIKNLIRMSVAYEDNIQLQMDRYKEKVHASRNQSTGASRT
jgi:hypothetical protein